jgi:hypothetical protein
MCKPRLPPASATSWFYIAAPFQKLFPLQVGTLAWTIAHIAADRGLSRRVYAQLLGRASASSAIPERKAGGEAPSHLGNPADELDLLEQCMRETNRLYAMMHLVRKVSS